MARVLAWRVLVSVVCDRGVALEKEGFQIGPLGLPRADGTAQGGTRTSRQNWAHAELMSAPDRPEPSRAGCRKGPFALAEASPDSPGELARFLGALGATRILQRLRRLRPRPGGSCLLIPLTPRLPLLHAHLLQDPPLASKQALD